VSVVDQKPIADRYEIRSLIGSGGMGEVYDAFDLRLERPVAVKVLRPGLAGTRGMVARVEAEMRLAAKIHHPNVVAVFDAGHLDDAPYIVMERLPGTSLSDRFRAAPLPDDEIRDIGRQVLRGLAAAHDLGIVHRDVKPSNVLEAPASLWKVADFGIATSLGAEATLTATGEVLGSPAYLAPERAEGKAATPASDVFSVGVLLYEAATGVPPVERDDPLATVLAIREGASVPLASRRSDLDPQLRQAIERALELEPGARWPSAAAFGDALDGAAPERTLLMPSVDVATTEPIGVAAVDGGADGTNTIPVADTGERVGSDADPTTPIREDAAAPSVRRSFRVSRPRWVSPSRALGIALGAAIVLLLLLGVGTTLILGDDDPPARTALPTVDAAVPDELRTSLEQLGEAITP
jgi:non-specific serine/threonine protein kinase/serine/threonine-protein kinase